MTDKQPLVLRLGKLLLWCDALRYDVYPRHLAGAELERPYTDYSVKKEVLHLTPRDDGKGFFRSNIADNLGTCQLLADHSVKLVGIGLTDTTDGGVVTFTAAAHRLAQLYRQDTEGLAWKVALAEQLLRYEVRIRTLVRYMTRPGACLVFQGERFLGGDKPYALGQMVLRTGGEERQIFKEASKQPEPRPFTHCILEDVTGNVGPFWAQEFAARGIDTDRPWVLQGIKGDYPPNQDIAPHMRPLLQLLYDLGLFQRSDGGWVLDTARFRTHFSAPLQADFLEWSEEGAVLHWLQRANGEGRRDDGYILTAKLAALLSEAMPDPPDDEHHFLSRWIARLEYQGHVQIIDHYRGLPGDGPGLHEDPNYQIIKLEFGGGLR